MSDIESVLAAIANRRPVIIDLSLDRIRAALSRLSDPQRKLPPVFHVAGTNGKGSTVAFIRAILQAAGHSVHVYTSPHLVRFSERIVVAGNEIEDAALIDALERTDAAMGDDMLTYFETTTCAALLAFAETPADYAVIEVGLGGRLDATNVFDDIAAAVVTPISIISSFSVTNFPALPPKRPAFSSEARQPSSPHNHLMRWRRYRSARARPARKFSLSASNGMSGLNTGA